MSLLEESRLSTAWRTMDAFSPIALGLLLVACASSGGSPTATRDVDSIRRYSVGDPPRCAYEEVARLESESRGMPRTGEAGAQEYVARRKRERGAAIEAQMQEMEADAIYVVRRGDQVGTDGWLLEELSLIRFTDRACTR